MAIAKEVEKIHIKRGKLHEDGTRDLSLVSKGYGKTQMKSDLSMPASDIWHWRLTPDYETKISNYPKPPIDKILWKPGEKEARRKAHDSTSSAVVGKTEKPTEETRELNDLIKVVRAIAPEFPALNS